MNYKRVNITIGLSERPWRGSLKTTTIIIRGHSMKIGILTFHRVYNYGAVIQAYCTQKIIDDLDIDNEIIDYTILKQKDFTDLYSRRNGLKRFFKTLLLIPFHSERFSRKKKFDAFINSMRLSDKKYIENEDLSETNKIYDCFIITIRFLSIFVASKLIS